MKVASLWRLLVALAIIIIIISGTIIIIIIRGPIPDPPPCLVCGIHGIKYLAVIEVLAGIVSIGLINRIRNNVKF